MFFFVNLYNAYDEMILYFVFEKAIITCKYLSKYN